MNQRRQREREGREPAFEPRSALEALFARTDDAAVDYITDELLNGGPLDAPPAVSEESVTEQAVDTEG